MAAVSLVLGDATAFPGRSIWESLYPTEKTKVPSKASAIRETTVKDARYIAAKLRPFFRPYPGYLCGHYAHLIKVEEQVDERITVLRRFTRLGMASYMVSPAG